MTELDVTATLEVEDGVGGDRPLSVDDFKVEQTGAASEATLAGVLAELGQKLEPGHLAGLASDATSAQVRDNVAAATVRLEAIRDRLPAALEGGRLSVATGLDLSPLATAAHQVAAKTVLDTIAAKDFSTQTTLAAVLAKLSADPSTGAKQDAQQTVLEDLLGLDFASQTTLAQVKAVLDAIQTNTANIKLDADHLSIEADKIDLSTDQLEGKLDTLNAKDFATQATLLALKNRADLLATEATLAALLTEIGQKLEPADIAALATAAKQDTAAALLTSIDGHVDGVEGLLADNATNTKLETIRALLAGTILVDASGHGLATSAKQDTAQTRLDLLASEAKLEAVRLLLAGTLTADVTDRAARLLGHVTVDNASLTTDVSDRAGRLVGVVDTELPAAAALGDGESATPTVPRVGAAMMLYNPGLVNLNRVRAMAGDNAAIANILGAGTIIYDQKNNNGWMDRANGWSTLLASAARTSTPSVSDQDNASGRGVQIVLDLTAFTTAADLTLAIQGKDPVSAKYFDLHAPLAINAIGTYVVELYPGVGAAAGGISAARSGALPRTWRVRVTHGNANSHTYSVGALPIR